LRPEKPGRWMEKPEAKPGQRENIQVWSSTLKTFFFFQRGGVSEAVKKNPGAPSFTRK